MTQTTDNGWGKVMLRFPADAPMVYIGGQWERCGDVIFATFTREQLELCLKLAQAPTFEEKRRAALRLAAAVEMEYA